MTDTKGSDQRSRGGRPPLPATERRSERIGLRFRADELAKIQRNARGKGLTVAAYIRARVRARLAQCGPTKAAPAVDERHLEVVRDLGHALNAAVRAVHAGYQADELPDLLAQLDAELRSIRHELGEGCRRDPSTW